MDLDKALIGKIFNEKEIVSAEFAQDFAAIHITTADGQKADITFFQALDLVKENKDEN